MKKILFFILFISLISCNNKENTVIIISANAEWKALTKVINPDKDILQNSPYGKWFHWNIGNKKVIFFHGGWGKIDAAGSAQYVINIFNPDLIINVGTAGGFPGKVKKGDVLLVNKTITYDIYEKMGDSQEAIDYYTSIIDYPETDKKDYIKISSIASADQDLFPKNIDMLYKKYGVFAADWESSAIAHVSKKNKVKCYIIRGITDIVYPAGSETYGDYSTFEKSAEQVMRKMIETLGEVL